MTKPLTLDDLARAVSESGDAEDWEHASSIARAILTTIKEAGWKIMPAEADSDMIEAGITVRMGEESAQVIEWIFEAMLNAAPQIEGE